LGALTWGARGGNDGEFGPYNDWGERRQADDGDGVQAVRVVGPQRLGALHRRGVAETLIVTSRTRTALG
jgi:hypothetical protein